MGTIDWDCITCLREDIGEADFAEVMALFFAEMSAKLGEMAAAVEVGPADFHFLRGSASNLGFLAMVAACEGAEAACTRGDAPDVDAVIEAFDAAMADARHAIPGLSAA